LNPCENAYVFHDNSAGSWQPIRLQQHSIEEVWASGVKISIDNTT